MNEENETLTMDGLMESMGVKPAEPTGTPTPAPQPEETPAPNPEDNPGENTTAPPAEGQQAQTQQPESKPEDKELPLEKINKEAHTFASMRKQISEQNKVLADIGKALGIEGKPDEILAGLRSITNAQKAKEAGVPPEIMERLTALEQEKAEREIKDRQLQVYSAINNFQRSMNLDNKQLQSFLIQLAQAGKNPFEQQLDLRSEYLVLNFDRLQKEAVQKALEQQAKLDSKASTQSTNPGTKTGGGDHKTTEVKTMDDLDSFLKANVK